ncbi:MAG: FtsQ-type POTRA domain-containing protein, partial [Clostridia bacterium]|nr:FtsQ-type POTRA domain-containing protein [Clostridia bacterium]
MNDTKKIEEIQKRAENKSKLQKYFTLFLVIIVIIFFLILAFHNLFNIKTIEVTGISNTAPYTTEDVSKFLDIKKDTNLITYDSRSAQKALLEEFPYINTVEIKK